MAPVPEEWNCKLYLIPISLTLNFNYRLWLVATVLGSRAPGYKESPPPCPQRPIPCVLVGFQRDWGDDSGAGTTQPRAWRGTWSSTPRPRCEPCFSNQ